MYIYIYIIFVTSFHISGSQV